ncbi:MAG: hypothetical protein KAS32_04870 [Candidatus Peribacteraceae bacterium]|nr:hypothetical protein [Candidatus Peribacteraceae bacterium]
MSVTQKEIKVLERQVSPLVKASQEYKIASVEDVDKASAILKGLRDTERNIEAERQKFTKPLNQTLRNINATFKEIAAPLVEARRVLTQRVIVWKTTERERIEKEEARRRKIQEAHEKKGHEVKAPVYIERPDSKIGSTQTRKVWVSAVADFSKVPDDYKMLDNVAVNQAIRNGVREIKGLKIYQKETLSIVRR